MLFCGREVSYDGADVQTKDSQLEQPESSSCSQVQQESICFGGVPAGMADPHRSFALARAWG